MAEILELSADVESTAPDGGDAEKALRQRAAALEGPRATPFSDHELSADVEQEPALHVEVDGLEPDDALEWDGVQSPKSVSTAAGEHHARVARNGRLLWAGWTRVSATEARLRLPVPEAVACSADDIGKGRLVSGRALAAPHARCQSYVLARARSGGGIEAAVCERDQCGKVVVWERAVAQSRPSDDRKRTVLPYAIAVSAGVLAITGVVLWQAGVFERRQAQATEAWVFNGQQKPMGFRF
jgi:hypothetical protein